MKSSLHDRAKGAGKMVKGKARETMGRAMNDRDMADEGALDQVEGKAQQKMGQVKKVFGR
jgi:uncharacterized protein YjbJ (UPF0337 family)